MRAPQPGTVKEKLAFAQAARDVLPSHTRWPWRLGFVENMMMDGSFQTFIDSEWEHTWTDEQCAAIAALYRLTK